MASGGSLIAHCFSNYSIALCLFQKLEDLGLIFDLYRFCFVLQSLIVLSHHVSWIKQISDRFNIYLLEGNLNLIRLIYCLLLFLLFLQLFSSLYLFKDMSNSSRNNSLILRRCLFRHFCAHCICFPTSGLAISKYAYIITIKETLNQIFYFKIDFILTRFLSKYTIKVENLLSCTSIRFN